jgi:hypothetical protein
MVREGGTIHGNFRLDLTVFHVFSSISISRAFLRRKQSALHVAMLFPLIVTMRAVPSDPAR